MSIHLTIKKPTRQKNKKPTKKSVIDQAKKARQMVKGLQIMWSDLHPEKDDRDPDQIFNKRVSHVNPVYRLVCNDIWDNHKDWILGHEFTWAFRVSVIYESNRDNKLKIDEADFTLTFTYRENNALNESVLDFILESIAKNNAVLEEFGPDHKSYGRYIQTDFIAEIVGI